MFSNASTDLRIPTLSDKVYKDECPFYYQTAEQVDGVFICLKHLIAVGPKAVQNYSTHTKSHIFLQFRIERVFKKGQTTGESKPTKLALGVPGGFELPQDRYKLTEYWSLIRFPDRHCIELSNPVEGSPNDDTCHLNPYNLPIPLTKAINRIQRSESALLIEERANNLAAWEDENILPISSHALELKQLDNGIRIAPSGWKCASCDLRENLWLNLTDGTINCGRRFFDGSGGNNHGVEHYERTGYPLSVKLGTITPETADVFSYAEGDMVMDPLLSDHLAHFGIDIMRMQKTDKTVAELEVSANERLGEWTLLQESDRQLQPRYGPGMTGLRNLGNTCYMNAVVQALFAIPSIRRLFAYRLPVWIDRALGELGNSSPNLPIDHVGLQFAKLGHALCSGENSWFCPDNWSEISEGPVPRLPGIRPQLFRRLMGRHNAAFKTKHQQDAFEFLIFLLDLLDSNTPVDDGPEPSSCFCMTIEDRLECGLTHTVRYGTHESIALILPISLDMMTNKAEYHAYEKRRQEVESSGGRIPPEEVVRPRIPFEACLSSWIQTERIEDFSTPASNPPGAKTHVFRSNRLVNFPDYLCVQLAKYTVGEDWRPIKLDVEIELNGGVNCRLDLTSLRSKGGVQPGEVEMPNGKTESNPRAPPEPDAAIMNELLAMGFTANAVRKACLHTQNAGLEAATNWLMEHLDDPTLNDAVSCAIPSSDMVLMNEDTVQTLVGLGLSRSHAMNALRHANNDIEAAAQWAFSNLETDCTDSVDPAPAANSANEQPRSKTLTNGSPVYELCAFISHMGKSTTDGHYVAHVKRFHLSKGIPDEIHAQIVGLPVPDNTDDEWLIFNDEKVARSESPPYPYAYIYLFRRLDAPTGV